ncbi:VWA domain-containing protein [Anatilimnocola floriformis]|uniref:VWA domain-containing protein n=1 Tax=Anatilimnocola floriformis TaxID=2948575 RepID=UPI0020C5939A|nr:VWA domain-containing protein [Anatilimnocola floriformis]
MKTNQHNSGEPADPFANQLKQAIAGNNLPPADPALREALLKKLNQPAGEPTLTVAAANRRRTFFQRAGMVLASTAALALVAFLWQRPHSAMSLLSWRDEAPPRAVKRANSALDDDFHSFGVGLKPAGPAADLDYREKNAGVAQGEPAVQRSKKEPVPSKPTGQVKGGARPGMGRGRGSGDRPEAEVSESDFNSAGITFGYEVNRGPEAQPAPTTAPGNPVESAPARPYTVTRGQRDYFESAGGNPAANEPKPAGGPASAWIGGEAKNPVTYSMPAPPSAIPLPAQPAGPGKPGNQTTHTASKVEGLTPRILVDDESSKLPTSGTPFGPANKELRQFADELAHADSEKLAEQLTQKDSGVKQRQEEIRQKFSKVVTLADDLKRERARGDLNEVAERKKLADLDVAIRDVQDTERKYKAILPQIGGEQYAPIVENEFRSPSAEGHAQSTFSIDVDTASYANTRRFLNNGSLPPPDAVRIEELVNYFKYKYPQPKGDDPFSVNMEMADCPWHPGHKLLRVGLQGKEIHRAERPASNIVFLIDTSGSMTDANKLPLLKQAFTMLTSELGENDKVTIVTYAGNAGLKLEPTRGDQKDKIIAAIDSLQSGGSTHGSAGITLAYEQAAAQFIKGGTNKVILATDGDLNVGITDDAALVDLITKKKESGVFLTVLGVGTGNLKDAKMERLADNGNGVYAYLDSVREARKVLVEEMSGSLVTIAKDVKIQIVFNPVQIQSYRLLGYENRVMANKDFDNDKKDAGEIGAGHSVTAFYEVVLADGAKKQQADADESKEEAEDLIYQRPKVEKPKLELTDAANNGELLTVKLRYKQPESDTSKLLKFPLKDKGGNFNSASADFQFASSVVAFGLALRNSEYRGSANLSAVSEIATAAIGEDAGGHRAEFLDLVRRAKSLRGE